MLYISAYFEARRDAYYDGLLTVWRENDWAGWCRFFLEAIRAQAEDNLARARAILELYEKMKRRLPEMTSFPIRDPRPRLGVRASGFSQLGLHRVVRDPGAHRPALRPDSPPSASCHGRRADLR